MHKVLKLVFNKPIIWSLLKSCDIQKKILTNYSVENKVYWCTVELDNLDLLWYNLAKKGINFEVSEQYEHL